MATNLLGYGPHQITADGDYDAKCVNIDGNRPELLTIGVTVGTFDGTATIKTRKRGSAAAFETAAYVKADGTIAAAGVSIAGADKSVQIDVTGKDVRITTAARTTGTLTLDFDVAADT